MITRRLGSGWALLLAGAVMMAAPVAAQKKYDPGASDSEIKLGQTMPYSGPLSSFATLGKAELAYYRMINEQGGVNGRKITLISLDDGYSPPKTVEMTRQLVEDEKVLAIVGTLGTPTNAAIRVPQYQRCRSSSWPPGPVAGTIPKTTRGP